MVFHAARFRFVVFNSFPYEGILLTSAIWILFHLLTPHPGQYDCSNYSSSGVLKNTCCSKELSLCWKSHNLPHTFMFYTFRACCNDIINSQKYQIYTPGYQSGSSIMRTNAFSSFEVVELFDQNVRIIPPINLWH